MNKMVLKAGAMAVLGAVVAGAVWHAMGDRAQARPGYSKAFLAKYPQLEAAASAESVKKCGVCHFGDTKKNRNDYAKAFGKGLPGKDCKDADAINAALSKAEGEKSPSGKTFGEIIKEGKLPNGP